MPPVQSEPRRRRVIARLRALIGVRKGQDIVSVMRTLFFRFAQLNLAFVALMLVGSAAPAVLRAAGAAGLAVLAAWWIHGRRRDAFPLWGLLLEGPAVAALAIGVGDPPMTLALMYVGLNFRAMYGPVRAAATVGTVYLAAHLFAVGVAQALGMGGPATLLSSPVVLVQIPGFALTVVVMRVLVSLSARRDREVEGQRLLAETGTALAAGRTSAEVAATACEAAATLVAGSHRRGTAVTALEGPAGLVVEASTDEDLVGRVLDRVATGEATPCAMAAQRRLAADTARALGLPWTGAVAAPLGGDGRCHGVVLVAADGDDAVPDVLLGSLAAQVTLALGRVEATAEVAAREARFSSLLATASDVVRVIDASFTIRYESEAVRHVLGHDPADLIGQPGFALVHPDDRATVEREFPALLEQPGAQRPSELRLRHADGSWRAVEGIVRNLLHDPAVAGLVVNYRDVTDRKALEQRLRHQALHDELTGLANRRLFDDRVDHALERQRRTGAPVGVLYIDVDGFKAVNDRYGHAVGDAMLQRLAQRLKAAGRASDTFARLGGDEFGVLVEPVSDAADVQEVAARVQSAITAPIHADGVDVAMRASVGVAVSRGSETAEELVRDADLAMYRDKQVRKAHPEHPAGVAPLVVRGAGRAATEGAARA